MAWDTRRSRALARFEGGGYVIGANLVTDIAGGRAAGLRTIWIDRGTWPCDEHSADHVVSDVVGAVEILQAERYEYRSRRLIARWTLSGRFDRRTSSPPVQSMPTGR